MSDVTTRTGMIDLGQLEKLHLQPGDVLVMREQPEMTPEEEAGVAHQLRHLAAAMGVWILTLPEGVEVARVDEAAMRAAGWVRATAPSAVVAMADPDAVEL